ncbi:hypothetical protein BK010_02105 [Tenericutes bacterium MO-XQ]|nr:hypothetical protein BK010_02105 [Tenericutes bacterium MO-XQ]
MRFDHWSKEKKQMLEYDYQQLFADQIMTLKKLYRFKADPEMFEDIITNISTTLFNLLENQHFEFVEELIERMFLSILAYDVVIYQKRNFSAFKMDLYFYNEYKTISIRGITISSIEDLKSAIELILFVGRKYDQLSLSDIEEVKNIDLYQLISGFNETFIKNNIKQLQEKFYIQ